MMQKNLRIARELVRMAEQIVDLENSYGRDKKPRAKTTLWKLVRVTDYGNKETMQGRLSFYADASDDEKMEKMAESIRKGGWKMPDDCVLCKDGNQFVVKHKMGNILEWRMFEISAVKSRGKAIGAESKYDVFKIDKDGSEKFVKNITIGDNESAYNKQTKIIMMLNHLHDYVRRQDIYLDNPNEICVLRYGQPFYKLRRTTDS